MISAGRAWSAVLRRAERRLPSLTRLRSPEALPIVLHRRRIYIVPTGFGLGFTVLLAVMVLGALNYSNNSALLLTCLVGAAGAGSMLVAFRTLDGVALTAIRAQTVVAGEDVPLTIDIAPGRRTRNSLQMDVAGKHLAFAVGAGSPTMLELALPTEQRGYMAMPRMRLFTTWPLGMFRAWSWLHPDHKVLVYPRAEAFGPPPRDPSLDADRGRPHPGDEPAALRMYRPGDPRRQIAWKLSARHEFLLVKDMEQPAPEAEWQLSWQSMHGMDNESRIARLARWVNEAHLAGHRWSLALPDRLFDVAQGDEHFHRCMTALALQP
jgi:uncharacterized protein (DUF58 family)